MYALIQDGVITQTGPLPHTWYDGTRWYDYRHGADPTAQGWQEVALTPRPTDDTTAWESAIELVDGQPVRVWTPRPWTTEEQAQQAETIRATAHAAALDDLVPATTALLEALHDTDPALIAAVQTAYGAQIGRQPGGEYVTPTGYHDAYPKAAVVTYDGREWTATRDGANGVPGNSPDWIEKVPEGAIPEWEQRHAGSEYEPGAIVQFQGTVYRNDHTGPNGWQPGQPGAQWTNLGPTSEYQP